MHRSVCRAYNAAVIGVGNGRPNLMRSMQGYGAGHSHLSTKTAVSRESLSHPGSLPRGLNGSDRVHAVTGRTHSFVGLM